MSVDDEPPSGQPEPDVPDLREVDVEGRRLLVGTAQVLAGLMTLGLLEHAEGPAGLLGTLFPTVQGDARDRALFLAGAVTGAGTAARRGRRQAHEVADARAALREAGFEAMGGLVAVTAAVLGDTPTPPPVAAPDLPAS